ncbi:unnamed protein product [Cyclocybe aegerita]|uniref:F-box domain-containing protein n=1 Tax=Cyclocybe aegerita TaxID=1973307 RepID=A0A8S0VZJ5_CYCAE|nr:unnamed protein product [Cyclocybe aegerita]
MVEQPSPVFPFDIWVTIIEAAIANGDMATLSSLSLCCYAFVPSCQRHFFHSIHISEKHSGYIDGRNEKILELDTLLTQSPHLATYARKLAYFIHPMNDKDIQVPINRLFMKLTKLEAVESYHEDDLTEDEDFVNWATLDEPLANAVACVITCPSLRELVINGFTGFSLPLLRSLSSRLESPHLYSLEIVDPVPTRITSETHVGPAVRHLCFDQSSALALSAMINDPYKTCTFSKLSSMNLTWDSIDVLLVTSKLVALHPPLTNLHTRGECHAILQPGYS